jgi:hypothetical protein
VALTVTCCAVAHAISCASVANGAADTTLSPAFAASVPGAAVLVFVLALLGAMLPLLLARRRPPEQPDPGTVRPAATVGAVS